MHAERESTIINSYSINNIYTSHTLSRWSADAVCIHMLCTYVSQAQVRCTDVDVKQRRHFPTPEADARKSTANLMRLVATRAWGRGATANIAERPDAGLVRWSPKSMSIGHTTSRKSARSHRVGNRDVPFFAQAYTIYLYFVYFKCP